ncbi:MAG TPA: hypothetical protein VGJ88_07545 [Thermoanaerobaculia bacterium]|jgi:Zn-finger nucleic acid-binding protein
MSLEDTFTNLASFLNSLDAEGEQKFELSHSLVIICPDCGKNIAFRGRCPKCGGNSWIPAGHTGGIFEQMKAQRWRTIANAPVEFASDDDDIEEPKAETRRSKPRAEMESRAEQR